MQRGRDAGRCQGRRGTYLGDHDSLLLNTRTQASVAIILPDDAPTDHRERRAQGGKPLTGMLIGSPWWATTSASLPASGVPSRSLSPIKRAASVISHREQVQVDIEADGDHSLRPRPRSDCPAPRHFLEILENSPREFPLDIACNRTTLAAAKRSGVSGACFRRFWSLPAVLHFDCMQAGAEVLPRFESGRRPVEPRKSRGSQATVEFMTEARRRDFPWKSNGLHRPTACGVSLMSLSIT